MVFKKKELSELKPDCIDFKPMLLNKRHCKLSRKCGNAGGKYRTDDPLKYPDLCTGVSEGKIVRYLLKKYNQ